MGIDKEVAAEFARVRGWVRSLLSDDDKDAFDAGEHAPEPDEPEEGTEASSPSPFVPVAVATVNEPAGTDATD